MNPVSVDKTAQILQARSGAAVRIDKCQSIQIINTYGKQVVDTWEFDAQDATHYMSMEHTRASLQKIRLTMGDTLVSNRREPMLTILDDTVLASMTC